MTKSKLIYGTPHNSADYRLNDWLEKNPGVVIRQFQFAVYPDHSNAICILYEESDPTIDDISNKETQIMEKNKSRISDQGDVLPFGMCVAKGNVYIDGNFYKSHCFDAETISKAIAGYLNGKPAETASGD